MQIVFSNISHFLKKLTKFSRIFLVVIIFAMGILTGYGIFTQNWPQESKKEVTQEQKYLLFLGETYDKILENYWESLSEEQLTQLYKQAAERLIGSPLKLDISDSSQKTNNSPASPTQTNPVTGFIPSLNLQGSTIGDLKIITQGKDKKESNQRVAILKAIEKIMKDLDGDKRKEFTVKLATAVLSSLSPPGRSGLFTQREEKQLKNTVQNINPEKDLYADLGLEKGAAIEEVEEAYQKKAEELSKDQSEQAKTEKEKISYAKEVLTDESTKQNYDTQKIEPTVSEQFLGPDIAYIKFDKFSPTTYDEFVRTVSSFDRPGGPTALIFDLRGNIGGAIDALPFFLGNFLGDKQYIYDFIQRGEYQPYRSIGNKLPGLGRLKQVVIMVDSETQSSAELMAAALKRYRFGILVGTPTKGWGTVEKIFTLENQLDESEKYSMLLVHSITLRDDNQPIEGRGVEPDINITIQDWQKQLQEYFRYPELVAAVKEIL